MPLLSVWKSDSASVDELRIDQVLAIAGDGALRDDSPCSLELREYLLQARTSKLANYIEHCLTTSFPKSGMVLQDLVNELARRLDYTVENGRYQGSANSIGFDGLWTSPETHTIVVEVKTTDAYRISLDTITGYRDKLIAQERVAGPSSILVVVGRDDTGELEAQVRGSRHAWDIRLISADSLVKLVRLKENTDDPETGRKIRNLLTPTEYTRLDDMVDVMFTTVADVEGDRESDGEVNSGDPKSGDKDSRSWQFTDTRILQQKRESIVTAIGQNISANFIKKSRALYWDAAREKRIATTISKRYEGASYPYWYAYHPDWDEFLREGVLSFFVLGGMDLPIAFSIPWDTFHTLLGALNTTTTARNTYWHIHIVERSPGQYAILLPKRSETFPLDDFQISIESERQQ